MSTVGHALEQDRDVFAVPGPLDAPMSEGTNRLIQQGAKLVTCGRDILEEYWDQFPDKLAKAMPPTPEKAKQRLEDLEKEVSAEKTEEPESDLTPGPEPPQAKQETISREQQRERFTDDELSILSSMGEKEHTVDELVELTQIPARRVLSALTMLQLQGSVEEKAGKRFLSLVRLEE